MKADPDAYAVLGLPPGAGPVAIERAYRRLIKRYHPDRRGGDSARAAEINSAYQELCRQFGDELGRRRGPPVPIRPQWPPRRRRRRWGLVLVILAGVLLVTQRDFVNRTLGDVEIPVLQPWASSRDQVRARPRADLSVTPLDSVGIDRSVLDAVRIAETGGEEGLAAQSSACHRQLRRDPDASRLDRCVAFDEAVIALLGRDPFREQGRFSASAVTARQFAAGRLVSNDMLAVESRLARIRTQVELSLAPPDPDPPARRPPI